jgi:hypothetical protein
MQSKQNEARTSQSDSMSQLDQGARRPDAGPVLRVVEPSSSAPIRVEIDFKYLDDGRVVELIQDPTDASKTKLAVFDSGKIYLADEVDCHGQILVPIGRRTEGLEDISLPGTPHPYQCAADVFFHTSNLISKCAAIPREYLFVVAAWVLHSWFADRLRPPVYLLVTGLPQSGKSTLLEVLRSLCRRPLLVAEITSAAAYDACSRFSCTLLIDENEWRGDQNSRALRKQLRAGTTKGVLAKRLGKTQHAFGAKALSSVELPDDPALRSRCIHVAMSETDRVDLRKPWDPQIVREADYVRGELLQFRLERYASVANRTVSGAEKLRPRSRDLLSSLIAPLEGDEDLEQLLLGLFVNVHDPLTRDLLSPTQSAVVAGLFEFIHSFPEAGYVQVGTVTNLANAILHGAGERIQLAPRRVSDVLATLGFVYRERSNRGSLLCLDQQTVAAVHKLVGAHDVQWSRSPAVTLHMEHCNFCQAKS